MKTHQLKTLSRFFNAAVAGEKDFEVRLNDRDFQVGDSLLLLETLNNGGLTGREHGPRRIKYILHGPKYGIVKCHCILGLETPANAELEPTLAHAVTGLCVLVGEVSSFLAGRSTEWDLETTLGPLLADKAKSPAGLPTMKNSARTAKTATAHTSRHPEQRWRAMPHSESFAKHGSWQVRNDMAKPEGMTLAQVCVARWIRFNGEPVEWPDALPPGSCLGMRTLLAMERKGFLSQWVPVVGGIAHFSLTPAGRAYLKQID